MVERWSNRAGRQTTPDEFTRPRVDAARVIVHSKKWVEQDFRNMNDHSQHLRTVATSIYAERYDSDNVVVLNPGDAVVVIDDCPVRMLHVMALTRHGLTRIFESSLSEMPDVN